MFHLSASMVRSSSKRQSCLTEQEKATDFTVFKESEEQIIAKEGRGRNTACGCFHI